MIDQNWEAYHQKALDYGSLIRRRIQIARTLVDMGFYRTIPFWDPRAKKSGEVEDIIFRPESEDPSIWVQYQNSGRMKVSLTRVLQRGIFALA